MSDGAFADDAGLDRVRPVVRTWRSGNLSLWVFAAVLLVGGVILIRTLSAARQDSGIAQPVDTGALISAPPPLALPQDLNPYSMPAQPRIRPLPSPIVRPMQLDQGAPARIAERRTPATLSPDDLATIMGQMQPPAPTVPAYAPPPAPVPAPSYNASDRVAAGRMLNPSVTVPKGTIVAAVLETALDSTRPGAVRAIVSRDVKSFDGSRILIPRGSRLYGEYTSEVGSGQKRAMINWSRLTRPDAVVIELDSPAADPLGRAGVEGRVNSHFFARFGGAILQSVLDIGVGIATRSVTDDAVIVALPGSTQQVTGQIQQSTQVTPTLRVRQGTSVSVFVARDLDFSTVEY